MVILWPDAVRNHKLLRADVHEAGVLEPVLQLGSGTGLVTGRLECTVDFVVVLLELGVVQTSVFGVRVAVVILELNPPAGFD